MKTGKNFGGSSSKRFHAKITGESGVVCISGLLIDCSTASRHAYGLSCFVLFCLVLERKLATSAAAEQDLYAGK